MSLSIRKLEKFLDKNNFIIKNIFTVGGMCAYIEVSSLLTLDLFLIYIPSRYDIEVADGDKIYKIESIDLSDCDNVVDNYGGEKDNYDLSEIYKEIELESRSNEFIETLEDKYNNPVNLKNNSIKDMNELRELSRQIKRLKLCIHNVKHKICILHNNFLCCLKRDDSIECYSIKKYTKKNKRRLYIVTDLELLHQTIDSIHDDLPIIYSSIHKVLDRNQHIHDEKLQKMLEEYIKISSFTCTILNLKEQYNIHYINFQKLFHQSIKNENNIINKIKEIEEQYNNTTVKGLHIDIKKSHHIGKLEKDLEEIKTLKTNIILHLLKVREKRDNISLLVDRIMFDNVVMLDKIKKNFNILETFLTT